MIDGGDFALAAGAGSSAGEPGDVVISQLSAGSYDGTSPTTSQDATNSMTSSAANGTAESSGRKVSNSIDFIYCSCDFFITINFNIIHSHTV